MKSILSGIKFLAFVAATLGLYSAWFIGRPFIPNKVYWRQLAFGLWTKSFVRISGMDIEIVGRVPHPPFFLVCNHLSYVDIAALRAAVCGVFVAKAEIQSWFLAGRIVRDMGVIFIDRTNRRDIPRAGAQIIERLNAGEGVIVFPEGTSTKGDDVLPFNSSFLEFAARTDLPVSYASITYRTPEGEPSASDMVCWWEDISFVAHMVRLFRLRRFTATITFGEEPVLNVDRKALATELRTRVRETFVPVT
jgi:1-acyl-sn-glycerol-3-phosphate acyltransferase